MAAVGIAAYLGAMILSLGGVHASFHLHDATLRNCMRSAVSFYDTTPLGRILNRFSKDTDTIDTMIPHNFRAWFMCTFGVLESVIAISVATPLILCVIVLVAVFYVAVQVVVPLEASVCCSVCLLVGWLVVWLVGLFATPGYSYQPRTVEEMASYQ